MDNSIEEKVSAFRHQLEMQVQGERKRKYEEDQRKFQENQRLEQERQHYTEIKNQMCHIFGREVKIYRVDILEYQYIYHYGSGNAVGASGCYDDPYYYKPEVPNNTSVEFIPLKCWLGKNVNGTEIRKQDRNRDTIASTEFKLKEETERLPCNISIGDIFAIFDRLKKYGKNQDFWRNDYDLTFLDGMLQVAKYQHEENDLNYYVDFFIKNKAFPENLKFLLKASIESKNANFIAKIGPIDSVYKLSDLSVLIGTAIPNETLFPLILSAETSQNEIRLFWNSVVDKVSFETSKNDELLMFCLKNFFNQEVFFDTIVTQRCVLESAQNQKAMLIDSIEEMKKKIEQNSILVETQSKEIKVEQQNLKDLLKRLIDV